MSKEIDSFKVFSDYPNNFRRGSGIDPVWVDNLNDLDADTTGKVFYHDKQNGYVCLSLCLSSLFL